MTIPTLPTPPNRSQDQATFDANIAAWIAALDAWTSAVNALGITTITGAIVNTPISGSTGAFTALSASGGFAAGSADAGGIHSFDGTNASGTFLLVKTSAVANISIGSWLRAIGTGAATDAIVYSYGAKLGLAANGSVIAAVSSTGLEVTGAISATTTIKSGGYTVATLPAGTTGDECYVTDATAPAWNTALTGGGAVVVGARKNATVWVAF